MSLNNKDMYVVTRNGRRVEPESYGTVREAQDRANRLVSMLHQWDPKDKRKVGIVKTKNPNTVT
jgi:hypothetical protein